MSDSLDEAMVELQRGYLAEFPDRLEELRDDIAAFRALRPEAAASLKSHFHRLAGSGGSYGFPEISLVAREMEQWMAAKPAPGEAPRLDAAVDRLATLFRQAQARMGTPARPAGTRLRATVILPASANPERIADAIEAEGYDVRLGHRLEDPSETPPGERPDLLIIGTAAGEGDPSAIASAWTGRAIRPRAVVLIETLRAVDRLRAIAAGVDAVIAVERMPEDLPRYARTLAQAGAPPSTVLVVEHDTERAAAAARILEEANVRVVRCALAQAVQELLDREVPDLMLLATRLPDGDGATVARIVREDPRFRMMPIVFIGQDDVRDRDDRPSGRRRRLPADPTRRRAVAADRRRARGARAPAARADPAGPAHGPAQPRDPARRAGLRRRLRPTARGTPVPAGVRPGPVPRGQRAVRPSGRRSGAPPRRHGVPLQRPRQRPHRPVRRRGVRDGAAGRRCRRRRGGGLQASPGARRAVGDHGRGRDHPAARERGVVVFSGARHQRRRAGARRRPRDATGEER